MGSQAKFPQDTKREEWKMEINGDAGKAHTARGSSSRNSTLASFLALLFPILFPLIHMIIFLNLWSDFNHQVDRNSCSCSCWDTVFKGPYESGIAKYKHMYFNSTSNAFKMWTITVIGVVILYESFKKIIHLALQKRVRGSMGILFLISLHSHYYAWWGYWNYWNDEFYEQWYHQSLFTVSELLCTAMVLVNIDGKKHIRPIPLLIVANISLFHILSSGWDQFVYTVIAGQGQLHQVLRDISLMTTDLLHMCCTIHELKKYARQEGVSVVKVMSQRKHTILLLLLTSVMYLGMLVFPQA